MSEPFKLAGLAIEVPIVEDLSNTERALLRSLAEPGNPLWKILRKMIEYREGLQQSLLTASFGTPEGIDVARKIQAAGLACAWVEEFFDTALTDVYEAELTSNEES